jgi:hypothetical protein
MTVPGNPEDPIRARDGNPSTTPSHTMDPSPIRLTPYFTIDRSGQIYLLL